MYRFLKDSHPRRQEDSTLQSPNSDLHKLSRDARREQGTDFYEHRNQENLGFLKKKEKKKDVISLTGLCTSISPLSKPSLFPQPHRHIATFEHFQKHERKNMKPHVLPCTGS